MDTTAERDRLENEKRAIQAYLDHPISRKIYQDNQELQNALIDIVCNVPVDSISAFFGHFEAVGHLKGLRRAKALIMDDVEGIERELKEIPNE